MADPTPDADDLLDRLDNFDGDLAQAKHLLEEVRDHAERLLEAATLATDYLATVPPSDRTAAIKSAQFIKREEYWLPLLGALIENGGTASVKVAQVLVLRKMAHRFNAADLALHKSSKSPRWERTVEWARNGLREEGYVRDDSPSGVWEITDAGRAYYAEELKRHA